MKNESPLKNWLSLNRWTASLTAAETGLSRTSVDLHCSGKAYLRESSIAAYKRLGVPPEVIQEHVAWMVSRSLEA